MEFLTKGMRAVRTASVIVQNNYVPLPYCPRATRTLVVRNYTAIGDTRKTCTQLVKRGKDPPSLPGYSAVLKQCRAPLSAGLEARQCWNCQGDVATDAEFCPHCKSLQSLDHGRDHFSILGLQKSFSIDRKALTNRFRKLQAQFHPDRYSNKSEREQQLAHDHSSAVNKAYQCLLHPVDRALYFLDLAGRPLEEGQIDLEPDFLMAIMEVNEELAEAEDRETVQLIGERNNKILDGLLSEADAAFSRSDIEAARTVVAKIKYYNNIYEKVKSFEREHGIVD